jgi:hypothetical protein
MSSLLLALPIRGEVDNDRMDFDLQGVEYVPAEANVIPCRFEEEVHEIVSALAVADIVSRSLVDEVETSSHVRNVGSGRAFTRRSAPSPA